MTSFSADVGSDSSEAPVCDCVSEQVRVSSALQAEPNLTHVCKDQRYLKPPLTLFQTYIAQPMFRNIRGWTFSLLLIILKTSQHTQLLTNLLNPRYYGK